MTETTGETERLRDTLRVTVDRLEQSRPFAKHRHQRPVLDVIARLLALPDGVAALYEDAPRLDAAGLFHGSDWDHPGTLLPQLVGQTLESPDKLTVALEAASLLRMLAIADGRGAHPSVHADHARHFLTQVLALNLRHFFGGSGEAARNAAGDEQMRARLFRFIADHVGFRDVLGVLVSEIWRILEQRPVQVGAVKEMVTQIAIALNEQGSEPGSERLGAERLVNALFGPTTGCLDDPGVEVYLDRISHMDEASLLREAMGFSRAMHDTGLVSDYHAVFLNWAAKHEDALLVPEALGLGNTGLDCWRHYRPLVLELIAKAVTAETPQSVHGLALLLERGVLHYSPIAPALSRQIRLVLHEKVAARLSLAFGGTVPPETRLLAGVLEVLGQPLGVGQGANPTCQSARAIAIWALNDPDFLLHLIVQAGEFDALLMHFEGQPINSADLPFGLAAGAPIDADPVSVLLVPHLDSIYAEMGRLSAPRGGDPHRWINPEFHGWWVARDCLVAVDVATGQLDNFEGFVTRFCESYHPHYNGDRPVIHPQPAGIAVTDASARFVGWHAIAILRAAEDQTGAMRVYFYNPNNDSGQDWGAGVIVSTAGNGERHGEASLPFEQFASRLYLFHDDPVNSMRGSGGVPDDLIARVRAMA
ncbi:MAG: hypothetical protein WCD16_11910, partial [Paracoccaceae bacterium]